MNIRQCLISLKLAAESMTGEQVAHRLMPTLAVVYQVNTKNRVAVMRDRASVNDAATSIIQALYTSFMDVGCFSHTLDSEGRAIDADTMKGFVSDWITLFAHSPKCRLQWKSQTDVAMHTHSRTRWWSTWEVMKQVHDLFGDVTKLVNEPEDTTVTSAA